MKRDQYPTFIDWWVANEEEYCALSTAQDGDPGPLAELIKTKGQLATLEARAFVLSLVMGKKDAKAGAKRTITQQSKELNILMLVRDIQKEFDCGEHRARNVFLDRHPDICDNNETLRTYLRRAKETLKQAVGRYPPAVVQKGTHSEPE
ncbi:hypothetical protein [Nereida ignava]|uniref:hypothetical protein n=1 Tax=Nereida ignava TaxID=282199 RepID=UPI003F6C099E